MRAESEPGSEAGIQFGRVASPLSILPGDATYRMAENAPVRRTSKSPSKYSATVTGAALRANLMRDEPKPTGRAPLRSTGCVS